MELSHYLQCYKSLLIDASISVSYLADIFPKTPAPGKDKPQPGPSKIPSLDEIKTKLSTAAKEVRLSSWFANYCSLIESLFSVGLMI